MKNFKSNNFDDLHSELVNYIVDKSMEHDSRTGKMYELIGLGFELTDPRNNMVLQNNTINYEYANDLLKFLLSSELYVEDFDDGNFAKKYPWTVGFTDKKSVPENYSTAYGPKIKNQLDRIIKLLKDEPDTRRALLHILIPEDKLVWDLETKHEYPCCNSIQFLIRNGKLNLFTQYRSNNIYKVLPYDLFLMSNIMILVNDKLETELGSLYFHATSAHVFKTDLNK